jgi:hypothetical protein
MWRWYLNKFKKALPRRYQWRKIIVWQLADVRMRSDNSPRQRSIYAIELGQRAILRRGKKWRHLWLTDAPKQIMKAVKTGRLRKLLHSAWLLSPAFGPDKESEWNTRSPQTFMALVECHGGESPNENKISDGWRAGAWLRVEGGIS